MSTRSGFAFCTSSFSLVLESTVVYDFLVVVFVFITNYIAPIDTLGKCLRINSFFSFSYSSTRDLCKQCTYAIQHISSESADEGKVVQWHAARHNRTRRVGVGRNINQQAHVQVWTRFLEELLSHYKNFFVSGSHQYTVIFKVIARLTKRYSDFPFESKSECRQSTLISLTCNMKRTLLWKWDSTYIHVRCRALIKVKLNRCGQKWRRNNTLGSSIKWSKGSR